MYVSFDLSKTGFANNLLMRMSFLEISKTFRQKKLNGTINFQLVGGYRNMSYVLTENWFLFYELFSPDSDE